MRARTSPSIVAPVIATILFAVAPSPPARGSDDLRDLIEPYETDLRDLGRFYDVEFAPLTLDRLDAFAGEWLRRLDAIAFEELDADGRVDWILLRNHVERGLAERADVRAELERDAPYVPFLADVLRLEEERWTLTPIAGESAAARLDGIASAAGTVKKSIAGGGELAAPAPEAAVRVAARVDRLAAILERWRSHYAGFDPDVTWWIAKPYDAARAALGDLAKHLREEVAKLKGEDDDPIVGTPLGPDALRRAIGFEFIAYGPEELLAIGEREFEWCDAELAKAARDIGFDDDVAGAIASVKARHAPPGHQDDLVLAIANEAIRFLDERDLVTIPSLCRELWRVDMMEVRQQRFLPFAAYGGQKVLVAYPTDAMDDERKRMSLRGNNEHFTRNVTPHELIPGHHLQGFQSQRLRPHRGLFRTAFLGEGWCLYWEMRFLDLGWARGPEDRIGMLFWRRHRAARILVSLRYHLGLASTDEMIRFLVDRVGFEEDGARGEVRRYIDGGYGPLYQCAYMIGGLQLRALREEVGDAMTERTFHDAVLAQNSIPIELIRARLRDLPLTRPARPAWRF